MQDKIVDALLGDARTAEDNMRVINGLLLAQVVCRRRLLDAFDGGTSTDIVLGIMGEIADTIEHLKNQVKESSK